MRAPIPDELSPKKKPCKCLSYKALYEWAGADLNRRHTDFQSVALPTELPARCIFWRFLVSGGSYLRALMFFFKENSACFFVIPSKIAQEGACFARFSSFSYNWATLLAC